MAYMTIRGKKYRVLRVDDRMGHSATYVVAAFTLRRDGQEYYYEETWSRPTMGEHRRIWRSIPREVARHDR